MPLDLAATARGLHELAEALEQTHKRPYGPECSPNTRQRAGDACVRFCGGDKDRGRTLWKLVVADCGGYMPESAAIGLIRAALTKNLVPDVEAPEVT